LYLLFLRHGVLLVGDFLSVFDEEWLCVEVYGNSLDECEMGLAGHQWCIPGRENMSLSVHLIIDEYMEKS